MITPLNIALEHNHSIYYMEHSAKVNPVHKNIQNSVSDGSEISMQSIFLKDKFLHDKMIVHTKPEDGSDSDQEDIEADSIADNILDKGTLAAPVSSSAAKGGKEAPEEVVNLMLSSDGTAAPYNIQKVLSDFYKRDFSQLRLHTDNDAAKANQYLKSRAFSYENNIFFNQGEYNLESTGGLHLLLHESAHIAKSGEEVNGEMTIDEKIKSGMILSTSEIMSLTTRRQRAEYLFTPDKNQPERGRYIFKNLNAVEDALAKRRIYSSEEDASADMETLKLNVIGDNGKIFTLRMKVHYKLSDYVRTMFREIEEAYSVSDPSDNFVFDENDKDGGAYNWRYSRMDKEYNLERIERLEDEITDIGLDDEVLAEVNDEVRNGKKASGIDNNRLKEKIAIDKFEFLLSSGRSEDNDEYKSMVNDIKALGLSDEVLDKAKSIAEMPENDNKQKRAKNKAVNKFLSPFKKEYERKVKDARDKYKSIVEYEKRNIEIDSTTQKKQEKIDKLEDDILHLKSKRKEAIEHNRTIEMENAVINGLKKGQKVSESTQAEIDRLAGESADSIKNSNLQEINTLLDEKRRQYELYHHVQTRRQQLPLIDFLDERNALKGKGDMKVMHEAYCKSPGDLDSDIKMLEQEVQKYFILKKTYEISDPEEIKERELKGLEIRKEEQEKLEKGFEGKKAKSLKTSKTTDIKRLDKNISEKGRQIENLYKEMPAYKAARFSEHSSGIAIDINPRTNPQYVGFENAPNLFVEGEVDKEENQKYFTKKYTDRNREEEERRKWHDKHLGKDRYTLKADSKIVRIFQKYGWKWGGEWRTRDYMHFEWFSKTWPEE